MGIHFDRWKKHQSRWIQIITTLVFLLGISQGNAEVFISEIHYDNAGTDTGEAIEITADLSADLSGWSVVLYNGANSQSYNTLFLSGFAVAHPSCESTQGTQVLNLPTNGIQNGSPDGLALVDASGNVVEFLSYEGEFLAANGVANGINSSDIGVAENGATPVGYSLQKIAGIWQAPAENTFGTCAADTDNQPPAAGMVKIHQVQGAGSEVAINSVVTVEAIVVAAYQAANQLSGFFIQEEDSDADDNPLTSEGIFVFCDSCPVEVAEGDLVRVTGLAQEYFDMSQLRATLEDDIEIIGSAALPSAASIHLPVPVTATDLSAAQGQIDAYYEPVEGMLINFTKELTVAEYFELGRYGQVLLSANGRPRQFTDQHLPSEAGYLAHQINMQASSIILDDDSASQNAALFNQVPVFHPQPGLSAENFFRGGDTIENLSGVLHYAFSEWRVRPTASGTYKFTAQNSRSETPEDLGGSLKVASFNVLNYFTSLDEPGALCAPGQNLDCRGADSANELYRQTQKIVAAICAIDADILGLMELENPGPAAAQTPINALVEAINAECGEYAAVETGSIGSDAITVGFIYKTATVGLSGAAAILDSANFTDPNNSGVDKNRPAVAQSFVELSKDATITIAVNHLKSKGSSCGAGDDDSSSGQGNCNLTRTLAAQVQANWLASQPTGVSSDYILVIGDLNAYRYEDPIQAFTSAGYLDLVNLFAGEKAYGYLFDGQLGYLDHGLANTALLPYVTGVTDWHINADEINLLDYNDTVQDASEADFEAKPSATVLFAPNPYRSSDHDPLIIGIDLPQKQKLQIADVISAYQAALDTGEIKGKGRGAFRHLLAHMFLKGLVAAEWYDNKGKNHMACKKLRQSANLSDGEKRPKDIIQGEGVSAINAMIHQVMLNHACE